MRSGWIRYTALSLLLSFAPARSSHEAQHSTGKRAITVADAVSMTHIEVDWDRSNVAYFSPDGKRFAVVLRKANLEKNVNEYTLLLFETAHLISSPRSQNIITLTSSSNESALSKIKWLSDSTTIAFLGSFNGEPAQVYLINCRTKALRKLTNHPKLVKVYDVSPDGETVVYVADAPVDKKRIKELRAAGFTIAPHQGASSLARGEWLPASKQLFVKRKGNGAPKLLYDTANNAGGERMHSLFSEMTSLSVSPDKKSAVVANYTLPQMPERWNSYADRRLQILIERDETPRTFGLVELNNGTIEPLLDAPTGAYNSNVLWVADSSSVIVSSFLPLDSSDNAENEFRRNSPPRFVEVDLKTKKIIRLREEWSPLKWDAQTDSLLMTKANRSFAIFKKEGGAWIEKSRVDLDSEVFQPSFYPKSSNGRFVIGIRQSPTVAPELVAYDLQLKKSAVLTDLNPQFRQLTFGDVEKITWKNKYDDECNGYLIKPVGYVPGKRYPAVLMMKGFNDTFIIDGQAYTTSFPPQPLANRGFVVLMVSYPRSNENGKLLGTIQEVFNYMSTVESAVDRLDQEGLIDRNKVGVMGFSRTSWLVDFMLTQSTYQFGAATSADSGIYNYISYMLEYSDAYRNDSDNLLGAAPFGDTFDKFRKYAAGLNVHKVRTPLLIECTSGIGSVLSMFEMYAGLRRLGKPVEMIYYPDGEHNLIKPSERMASLQRNVDWYRFWLKGEEDPARDKREQYARWRELRLQYERNQHGPRTSANEY